MDIALQQLWHEHIRTITSTVKQLSRELDAIKQEVRLIKVQHLFTPQYSSSGVIKS